MEKINEEAGRWSTMYCATLEKRILGGLSYYHVHRIDRMDAIAKICERDNDKRETCGQMLDRLMKERNMSISQLSKASGIEYNPLWKILKKERRPEKETLAYLAIGLRLSPKQMDELLKSAGRGLTTTDPFDVAVSICVSHGIYNLEEVNAAIGICDKAIRETG